MKSEDKRKERVKRTFWTLEFLKSRFFASKILSKWMKGWSRGRELKGQDYNLACPYFSSLFIVDLYTIVPVATSDAIQSVPSIPWATWPLERPHWANQFGLAMQTTHEQEVLPIFVRLRWRGSHQTKEVPVFHIFPTMQSVHQSSSKS
jgi:hypothetical protein